ncbi:EAL domain-containing protein [Thalassotalea euphylliae]|uniref:EAL domain-containing protein n=1 Tax=Thalassotalea euphylliae TaxID=1655234 RepID=A0A3E0TRW7_9GAMM|nr:EAL domain-containing protein [Thalassotalea euphylliae]REL27309.1 EAL domain-containing protein [Thalassotalea euphylliae]
MNQQKLIRAIDIVQKDILWCDPKASINQAATLVKEHQTSSILIKQGEKVLGIWTEADCTKLDFNQPELFQQPIERFMSSPVISVDANTSLQEVILAFHRHKIRHLLVTENDDKAIGIISQSDVIKRQRIEHYLQLRKVKQSYNPRIHLLTEQDSLSDVVQAMANNKHSSVIIQHTETGDYGIITERDLLKVLAKGINEKPLWDIAASPLISINVEQSLLEGYLTLQRFRIRHLGVVNNQGKILGVLSQQNILSDIEHSYFQQLEEIIHERDHALNASQKHLFLAQKVIESSLDAIMISDQSGTIISVNPAFTSVTGYKPREVIGGNANILNSGRHDQAFYQQMWGKLNTEGKWQGEIWNKRKNGEIFPEWLTIVKIGDDLNGEVFYTGIFSDITERKLNEARIKSLAFYDELTKLPNRRLFSDRLDIAISTAHRNKQLAAILFIDLDRFKQINDTLGHDVGDELLVSAAKRISNSIKEGDTVSRFGGDEFVILLTEMHCMEDIEGVINRIYRQFNEAFYLDGKETYVTCSIGASIYPFNGTTAEELLKQADIAMYQTKQQGRNGYAFYQRQMHESLNNKLQLQNKLRVALKDEEFELSYQPQIDSESGKIVAVETLLRWYQRELGAISPADFIPLAEELGIIVDIERWVLTQACIQRKTWLEQQQDIGRIAVNVSAIHFNNNLLQSILSALEISELPAKYLEIEVTESCFIENIDEAKQKLQEIKALGVTVALDDFGTGYSSLSYLTKLSIDTLKIDASFIQKTPENPRDCQLVKTIINMAQSLSMNIVAEGVENKAQQGFLSNNQCNTHQGYYYLRPTNADHLFDTCDQQTGVISLNADSAKMQGFDKMRAKKSPQVDTQTKNAANTNSMNIRPIIKEH